MEVKSPEQGWRSLFAAILNKAISDTRYDSYKKDAVWFAGSSYCMALCDELEIDYEAYLKAIRRRKR